MESLLLTPRDLGRALNLGRNKTYELLATGQIPIVRIGRAIRIPRAAVEEWIKASASGVRSDLSPGEAGDLEGTGG